MGRHKTATPKTTMLHVRLDAADEAIFLELLRRRREALGASDDEYTSSMFIRGIIRKLGEEAGLAQGTPTPGPRPPPATRRAATKAAASNPVGVVPMGPPPAIVHPPSRGRTAAKKGVA